MEYFKDRVVNRLHAAERSRRPTLSFWPCHAACGMLVLQPGIEPGSLAMSTKNKFGREPGGKRIILSCWWEDAMASASIMHSL